MYSTSFFIARVKKHLHLFSARKPPLIFFPQKYGCQQLTAASKIPAFYTNHSCWFFVDVNLRCTNQKITKLPMCSSWFFLVCFEQSMSFLLHPTKNHAEKIGSPGRPGIHQSFVDEFGALDSGLYPPWNWQQKPSENGGPLEVWRGTYWKTINF